MYVEDMRGIPAATPVSGRYDSLSQQRHVTVIDIIFILHALLQFCFSFKSLHMFGIDNEESVSGFCLVLDLALSNNTHRTIAPPISHSFLFYHVLHSFYSTAFAARHRQHFFYC